MAKVTDIQTQKKRDSRASIFLDGKYYCGLEKITLLSEGLKIGDEISAKELEEIQNKSESTRAFDKAVKYLALRPRSEKEMNGYLKTKGYLPLIIDNVIKKLKEYKYIDDAQFAEIFISSYRRKLGEKRLSMELRRLGIDKFTIEDAIEDLGDQTEEAVNLGLKYYRSHKGADSNKLYGFLYSKGFDYSTIKEAIAAIEETLQEEENLKNSD